jgi:hypothetical protein
MAKLFSRSGLATRSCLLVFVTVVWASPGSAASAPPNSVQKIVNGKYIVDVDNGWVVFQDQTGGSAPSLRRYILDGGGNFTASATVKLKTAGAGAVGNGALFNVGGITFGPCPAAAAPSKCAPTDFATQGVGLAFGQTTLGAGSATAGWFNDATVTARFTSTDSTITGSVAAIGADPTNGAYAVGWTLNTGTNHALVMGLDSAGQTYKVVTRTDLGTLGGPTSQALGISKNALHVVGIADDASSVAHAVYAPSSASTWVDITAGFPSDTIESRAFVVSNTGIVAGSYSAQRNVAGHMRSVDIGFVYNTNTHTVAFFEAPGANVIPLSVLDDGRVVGNLEYLKPAGGAAGVNEMHPFLYDGSLHDFGTMLLPGGANAFSCRANRPNRLGELAGSCVPNASVPFGGQGTAFYINTIAATPTFVNLNASLHANADVTISTIKAYSFGTATSIDDEHEITFIAINKTASQAAWIASQAAYLP